jgi:hypothetical protein
VVTLRRAIPPEVNVPKDPKEFSSILPSASNYPLDAGGNPILPQQQSLGTGWGSERPFRTIEVGGGAVAHVPGPGEPRYSQEDIANAADQSERSSGNTVMAEGGALPRTWKEAIPYVVWVVLILGFGLELVASLVRGEWLHFIVSFVGLVGLMAAALHWNKIKSWAQDTNPNWVWGAFALLLLALIFSPFIEQQRWPFSRVFHDPPSPAEIAKAKAPLLTQIMQMQAAMDEVTRERDELQRQIASSQQGRAPPTATAPDTSPINWTFDSQFLVNTGSGSNALINSVLLQGTSTTSVAIKEAYAVSGLTGHKQELMANVSSKGYYPVDKVDIPPQAPVWLELVFKPPLSIRDFLDQWGKISIKIVYNDGTYVERDFDETFVRRKLQQIPGALGPHITPRDD